MRKMFAIVIYTIIVLLVGRNLTLLPRFTVFSDPAKQTNELKQKVTNILHGKKANYSIFYANFSNGDTFGINEKEIFTAASLNKVPIVLSLYIHEKQGKIDLDEQITLQREDVQDYGTGSLRYEKPGSVYSLKTLAKLALKQSDNTAAHILGRRLGFPTIHTEMERLGLSQTHMDENKTSAYDMYILFKRLYRLEITDVGKSQEILDFMKDTDIEDRLPALLPKETIVYHKTADALGNLHDVGIIKHGDLVFFLGILVSDVGTDERETKQTMGEIAKTILEYYQQHE